MVSINIGIHKKYWEDFNKFCQENDIQIDFASDIYPMIHAYVSCDPSVADRAVDFKNRTDLEHYQSLSFFGKVLDFLLY